MGGLVKRFLNYFKNMDKGKRIRLIVLVSIAIVIIITVSVLLTQQSYATLYSGMDAGEAGEVMTMLQDMGVDAKAQGEGTILVAEDQADSVRMQLAAQGYPNSGINFDIFQNAAGLGVTDMEKRVYYEFQLAENIRQTIRRMNKVDDAIVNINLPEESAFVLSDNEKPATASVTLSLTQGQTLDSGEVKAIAELVSSSISGLKVEDVRIIDTQMNLYTVASNDDEMAGANSQRELQQNVQQRMQTQITNLLNPVFGEGNVLAEVSVELNFDTKVTETIVFEPPVDGSEEGIVVSMSELTETVKGDGTGGVAGVDSNGGASTYPALEDEDATYLKISKEVNYEINQTKTQIEDAKGQIEALSVAVILNSVENLDDYTDNVKELVSSAIGVGAEHITVEMLPFKTADNENLDAQTAFAAQQELLSIMQGAQTTRLIILIIGGIAILVILLMIIRMLRKPKEDETEEEEGAGIDLVAGEEEIVPEAGPQGMSFDEQPDNRSVLGDYIKQNAESVANLLRNWLNDDN